MTAAVEGGEGERRRRRRGRERERERKREICKVFVHCVRNQV